MLPGNAEGSQIARRDVPNLVQQVLLVYFIKRILKDSIEILKDSWKIPPGFPKYLSKTVA